MCDLYSLNLEFFLRFSTFMRFYGSFLLTMWNSLFLVFLMFIFWFSWFPFAFYLLLLLILIWFCFFSCFFSICIVVDHNFQKINSFCELLRLCNELKLNFHVWSMKNACIATLSVDSFAEMHELHQPNTMFTGINQHVAVCVSCIPSNRSVLGTSSAHRRRSVPGTILGLNATGLRGPTNQVNAHDASRRGCFPH